MVLLKPGKLENEEFEVIQYHSTLSAEIVNKLKDYAYLSDIVKHHHEHYDGSGYPDGLKGSKIPFLSRILALCDVFDALTTKRIYRKEKNLAQAVEIMDKMVNEFDPFLWEKFRIFIKKRGIIKESLFKMNEKVLESLRNNIFFMDMLTKLLNRNAILALLQKTLDFDFRISVVKLNIKNFMDYNKKYGMKKGDELLRFIAGEMKNSFKAFNVMNEPKENRLYAARITADKFILLSFGRRSEYLKYKLKSFIKNIKKNHNIEMEYSFVLANQAVSKNIIHEVGYLL